MFSRSAFQGSVIATSSSLRAIYNYRQAAPNLATSGQPTEEQLQSIAAAGYQVVINLAIHNDPRYSLKDEAQSVHALGLEYIHIPVQFAAPTPSDLQRFYEAMDAHKGQRIWVHCAANYRVTAFVGLYRCTRQGYAESDAFALMREVWQPDATWSHFIETQLHGKSSPQTVFGNLKDTGLEVVERDGRYFVRYDAGSHQMLWREDEISSEEFAAIQSGKAGEYRTLLEVQKRLTKNGEDPQTQNWTPPTAVH